MALTKADISERLAAKIGLNKREAKEVVECFFHEIIKGLVTEGEVKLSGFGNFSTRDKKARPGRNPKTGEAVEISARRVVTFHAGQKLKTHVEQYAGTNDQEDS
ncbi:MAG: integration host factor subunit alpha [Legionellales bacterium]|nr:integration host factor subunit alpha [Legionellales bacterium]|tara:strand:- start:8733 stop:9044 length:312 start_codon:yes stop_codon:yes gene_type:complete